MPFSHPDRLGSYEVVAQLGSGGMGVVYRARDPRLQRDVAIKVLSARGASDPERRKRFEREARAASALDHPNIVTIHEIGETDDGLLFLVMQLVEGQSLRELIDSRHLGLKEVISIATQVSDGLSRAHRHGIVHRDLKPENIMVNTDGLVKILDFGLAKLLDGVDGSELATLDRDRSQTKEGRIVGTAPYMSPEQAQGATVDARSDIFSLGAVLYEMAARRRAFSGDTSMAVLAEIVRDEPERLTAVDPSLPLDLDKIVHRALRKDPDRRFQNASDLKVALAELAEELESGDALTASDIHTVRRKRRWWPLGLAAAIGVAAVAIVLSMRPPDLPPMRIVPLSTDPGYEDEPALSPDGKQVAFVKSGHIYVKLIGEGEAVQLTSGDVNDASPAWSPDGTRVAFLRHRGSLVDHTVLEVPAVGGTPRTLGETNGAGHGVSYSPAGTELVVAHAEPPDLNSSLYLLSRENGEKRRLTSLPPDEEWKTEDRFPRFSPDGRFIAFLRVEGSIAHVGDVLLHELATAETRVLVSEPGWLSGVDFTPDGRHVVYSVGQSPDSFQLEVVPAGGGEPRAPLPGERAMTPSMARTAHRMAYVRNLDDANIYRVSGPAAEVRSPPMPFIASTAGDAQARPSPDGSQLAFTSTRTGTAEIWIANADGSSPRRLTNVGFASLPQWSPDGSRIAFVSAVEGRYAVYVVDAAGGFARKLTSPEFRDLFPCWSADGGTVYYESTRGGAPGVDREIWKVPAEGGEPERVVKQAYFPQTSANGTLYFRTHGGISRIREGEIEAERLPRDYGFDWALWGEKIVGQNSNRSSPRPPSIEVFDIATGETETLAELDGDKRTGQYGLSVSADGQWVFYHQLDSAGSDIMLVENFVP